MEEKKEIILNGNQIKPARGLIDKKGIHNLKRRYDLNVLIISDIKSLLQ